ncbi:prephenate dehydratase, partial [Candidatus Gottesmanbacteria bacterium]|nr:prephenate dehydratase [Candidatus Gottesmanbacteria bacterium]
IVPKTSIEDVAGSVASGESSWGVLPIENSIAGTVHETFDAIVRHELSITKEIFLPIAHHLLIAPVSHPVNQQLQGIKTIFSHPKAFEQCRIFLKGLPHARLLMVSDTSTAAGLVARHKNPREAAIGSLDAAKEYGLQVLVKQIQDNTKNCTRFVVVQKNQGCQMGTKATLCAVLPHVPGSLHTLLGCFAKRRLNLTKIESRPIADSPWEYLFYLDIDFGTHKKIFDDAILEAKNVVRSIKVLGTYEKGSRI